MKVLENKTEETLIKADGKYQNLWWLNLIKCLTAAWDNLNRLNNSLHVLAKDVWTYLFRPKPKKKTCKPVNVNNNYICIYAPQVRMDRTSAHNNHLIFKDPHPIRPLELKHHSMWAHPHLSINTSPQLTLQKKIRHFVNTGSTFCGIGRGFKTLVGLQPVISTAALCMWCFLQQRVELCGGGGLSQTRLPWRINNINSGRSSWPRGVCI